MVLVAYKPDGSTLKDLEEEPKKVKMYKSTGKGLIDTIPLVDLMSRRKDFKDWFWVWDGNHNQEENNILRKEGFKVIGGLEFAQKMEHDRAFTMNIMQSLGLVSPEFKEFKNVADGVKFLQENPDKAYVYKPNDADTSLTTVPDEELAREANTNMQEFIQAIGINDFVLQEKVKGVEVNVEYFCMNGVPVLAHGNLECKRRTNGDYGKPLGCAMDVSWVLPMDCKLVEMTVAKLKPLIKKLNYTGFADLNVIIGDEGAYFLETCWRNGYNAHPTFFTTVSKQEYFSTMADMIEGIYDPVNWTRKGFGASITMRTDFPYPGLPIRYPEAIKDNVYLFDAKKSDNGEGVAMTGWSEDIAIITALEYDIESAFKAALKNVEKVRYSGRDRRSDAHEVGYPTSPVSRYRALETMGLL